MLKRFVSGEKVVLPAGLLNAWTAAAEAGASGRGAAASRPPRSMYDPSLFFVRNDTGYDLDRFSILGISSTIIGESVDSDEFKSRPAFTGATPATASHTGRFVVTIEPLVDGAIGRAVASGVVPVKVDMDSASDTYAEIANGQRGYLSSSSTDGSARILYAESGTGQKWALVRIGGAAAAAAAPDEYAATADEVYIHINAGDEEIQHKLPVATSKYAEIQSDGDIYIVDGVNCKLALAVRFNEAGHLYEYQDSESVWQDFPWTYEGT